MKPCQIAFDAGIGIELAPGDQICTCVKCCRLVSCHTGIDSANDLVGHFGELVE